MNHDPRLSPSEEYEWSLQERALADQRAGLDPTGGDASLGTYRLMAQLLAQPPEDQLPADFARRVARQVQPGARLDTRLERGLLGLLVVTMAVAGFAVVVIYGGAWLPALDQGMLGAWLAKPWAWVLVACLGLSRMSRHWLHHDQPA
ncbi:hypothetical protein ACFWZ4_15050 [Frateuria sp. GZRe12]|uniref:hypothetical protein n=1 Tax=Frateuria sp. GZRe12 TaxID=3351533 RepID=UPI003EDCABD5